MSEPEVASAEIKVDRRWLWVVRLIVLASILVLITSLRQTDNDFPLLLRMFLITPVLIPYLKIILRLRQTPQERKDVVLGLTMGWALLGLLALSLIALLIASPGMAAGMIVFGVLSCQLALALGATKIYRQLPKKEGDRRVLAWSVVETCFYLGLFVFVAILIPGFSTSRTATYEASAISSVRNIVTSQVTYSATLGNGSYSSDLAVLSEHGLIDSVLASGTKDGFTFTTAAVNDGDAFTVQATPLRHGETGTRSFFADETGVIRYTTEDRPATSEDPPL